MNALINRVMVGDRLEIWLIEQWEELIGPSQFLPSPPGYFKIKAELDAMEWSDRDALDVL